MRALALNFPLLAPQRRALPANEYPKSYYRVKIFGGKESTEHEATWKAFNNAGITS